MTAMAKDMGDDPRYNVIDLDIRVVESHKKAPTFTFSPHEPIRLYENFSDYEASIARVEAQSNIDESPGYFLFELVTGRTEQTNKENTFRYARMCVMCMCVWSICVCTDTTYVCSYTCDSRRRALE